MASPNPRTARIIDAGVNRAREGLRVLEDLARFALDDRELSERAKRLRHELAEAVAALPLTPADLLAARDTPGDVGTEVSTASERTRASEDALAAAAAGRATEALRSIEEGAKTLGSDGSAFERLRYEAYELERLVRLALRTRVPQWRLCVLITAEHCRLPWEEVAEAAIRGGADCLQLREKQLEGAELLTRARRLREITRGRAAFIVNDRPDIAVLAGADGVHLGQNDLDPASVRALARGRLAIGVSCTNAAEVRRAVGDGADYVGLGPMFATATKIKPNLAGPEFIAACLADGLALPHLAVGGIAPGNIDRLARAGCRGVAVCSAVCSAPDPERICREILAYLPERTPAPGETTP